MTTRVKKTTRVHTPPPTGKRVATGKLMQKASARHESKTIVMERTGGKPIRNPRQDPATQAGKKASKTDESVKGSQNPRSQADRREAALAEIDLMIQEFEAMGEAFGPTASSSSTPAPGLSPASAPPSRADLKSTLVKEGALPAHIDEALSLIPDASEPALLTYCLLRGIGIEPRHAERYACKNIPNVKGEPAMEARLAYGAFRAAGYTRQEASELIVQGEIGKPAYFREAANLPEYMNDPSTRANYCAIRARANSADLAQCWASAPPGSLGLIWRSGDDLQRIYTAQANCEIRPGTVPRFIGNSIPSANGKRTILGKGSFNQVELLKIIDPRDRQEREFAFKPSRPDPTVGFAGQLTGIKPSEYFPESRNLAAVAVARVLGLTGEDGVTGEAFMGIVDGRLGLLMEVTPGQPVAQHDWKMRPSPGSDLHHLLVRPDIKETLMTDQIANQAFSKILGVHSIRYEGAKSEKIFFAGSASVSGRPDNLEPFKNNNASLKRAYARVELFDELINEPDGHPGNIFVEAKPGGQYCARRIDLDMGFGTVTNHDLEHEDSFMTYFLPMLTSHVDKPLADRMQAAGMRDTLEWILQGFELSDMEIEAFLGRFDAINAGIQNGDIKVIDDSGGDYSGWTDAVMDNPTRSLFARDGQRPRFS